jgi:DNA polymerase I-like protein with 3'-5' exonuclease and polymerase domains
VKFKAAKEAPDQLGLGFSVEEMTRVPPSSWQAPDLSSLPDRLEGEHVGVDTETRDEGISQKKGAGWAWRGGGYVVGYSVCADNFKGYLPIRHDGGGNVDADQARRWLSSVLSDERQTKVFAHAQYDLGWAGRDGVKIEGPIVDVQWVEALLDEHRWSYSLDAIAKDRVGSQKDESVLRSAAKQHGVDPKSELWKLPAKYVGPYAETDASLTRDIWAVQRPLVEAEDLQRVVDLEHALLPMYLDMRRRGVRIDVSYAEQLRDGLREEISKIRDEVRRLTGKDVEPWAAKSVAEVLEREGVKLPRTANGGPSVTQELLQRTDHPFAKLILRWRERDKLLGTFVEGQILNQIHGDRVHGEIHPLKADDGGTVTGRLSMSNPNLQFIPARTAEGKMVRRCFVGERGEQWASLDFSQQEPRLLVHFAYLTNMPGADEARRRYREDPDLSYHKFTAELMRLDDYKLAKILNLAIIYGRGIKETANQLQRTEEETKAMFARHNQEMPFAKALSQRCMTAVNQRGYVKSLSGRRMRFPLWEPKNWDQRDGKMLKIEEAQKKWEGAILGRARIHKALNSLIQPSAADQMKEAMLAVHREGYGGRVLVQVHDELGCSVPDEATARRIAEIMESAVTLEVPSKVDVAVGQSWKDAD